MLADDSLAEEGAVFGALESALPCAALSCDPFHMPVMRVEKRRSHGRPGVPAGSFALVIK